MTFELLADVWARTVWMDRPVRTDPIRPGLTMNTAIGILAAAP